MERLPLIKTISCPPMMEKLHKGTFPVYDEIHEALHDRQIKALIIDGIRYPIKTSTQNGCRYLEYTGIKFMEQNPNKKSSFAARARNGEKITWGIQPGEWLLIEN
jgi:hypothetical protein